MAAIDELIAQLAMGAAQKQAIAESDPYAPGMGIADQIGSLAVNAGPQYKTRDKIILGALSGLAGGLFSGASQDYQSRAADAYSDAVFGFGQGKNVEQPSVLSPTLFSSAKQQGNLFNLRRSLQAGEMADSIAKETRLAEIKGAQEIQTELAKEIIKNPRRGAQAAEAIANLFGKPAPQATAAPAIAEGVDADASGLELALGGVPSVKAPTETDIQATLNTEDAIMSLPDSLQGEARKEVASLSNQQKSLNFIDEKFDQAKSLVGTAGAYTGGLTGIPTDASKELEGIGDSLVIQLDAVLGRELNSDVRNRLLSLAPKFYDNADTLTRKNQDIKALLSSLAPSTPLLETTGIKPSAAVAVQKDTGKTSEVITAPPAQKANVATQVQAPSWSQSARFVGKSLAEGVGNTLGLAADINPFDPNRISRALTGQPAPSTAIKEAVTSVAGSPDDEGIAKTPGVNVIRSGLNAVAFPGAPVSNALAGMGAQGAKEAGAGPVGQVVAGIAAGSAPSVAKGLSNIFKQTGKAFDRSSVGALAKDFVKSQRDKGLIESADEAKSVTTRLATAIEEIADKKGLGFWRDPDSLAGKNEKAMQLLGGKIGAITREADNAGAQASIDFSSPKSSVAKLVDRAKAEKGQVKEAFDEFLDTLTDPVNGWDGSISSLNEWKTSVGNLAFSGSAKGSLAPAVARKVKRAIYSDLDRAVAESVDSAGVVKTKDWKQLLRDYSNHAEIEPIIAEQVAKGQSSNIEKATSALLRTSGGTLTTPVLIGAGTGAAVGGPAGLIAGAALGSLRSPTIQGVVGSGLQKTGKALSAVGAPASAMIPATAAGALSTQPTDDLDAALSQARQSVPVQAVTPEPAIQEAPAMPINPIVSEFEGGQQLKAYDPPAKGSGVTVATGIDLGQRSVSELKNLGISEPLIKKVSPYLGKKDDDAKSALKKQPLSLSKQEADELDEVIGGSIGAEVNRKFMEATGQDIALLPEEAQTVIASLAHNFGPNLDKKLPSIWGAILQNDWATVQEKLRTTKWKQPELAARRNKEADILDSLVGVA